VKKNDIELMPQITFYTQGDTGFSAVKELED